MRGGTQQELIDGDQINNVDQYTNYKKEDNANNMDKDIGDQLSEG